MWFVFALFFLLYGQLFWAIKQSRGRINGVSYCWSGFGFQKWTNVRDFEDYSTWVSLVLRSEGLGGICMLIAIYCIGCLEFKQWFPWTPHCVAGLLKHSSRFAKDQVEATQKAACLLCELECHFPSYSRWRRLSV